MTWRWKNFSESEICDTIKGINSFNSLSDAIIINLSKTLDICQVIRDFLGYPLAINSTWRPGSDGSAHQTGKAIDIQPKLDGRYDVQNWGDKYWCKHIFEHIEQNWRGLLYQYNINHMRVFWEYRGLNAGWLHIDTDYNPNNHSEPVEYWISPEKDVYIHYEGKAPFEY